MTRLTQLGRGVQIMLVAGALLLADSFLDWQRVEFTLGRLGSGSVEVNAWDDFLGAMMGLLTIALLVWIGSRIAGFRLPIPVSEATVDVLLGGLVFVFALAKNLTNDYSTWASYVGVGLALLIFGGAVMELRSVAQGELASADPTSAPGEAPPRPSGGAFSEGDASDEAAGDLSDGADAASSGLDRGSPTDTSR